MKLTSLRRLVLDAVTAYDIIFSSLIEIGHELKSIVITGHISLANIQEKPRFQLGSPIVHFTSLALTNVRIDAMLEACSFPPVSAPGISVAV